MTTNETVAEGEGAASVRAELLRRRLSGNSGARRGRRIAIEPVDRSAALPLSFGQQQMWFLQQLDPGSTEYLVPLVLRLRGPLDTGALIAAWERIVERHETLRTRYVPGPAGEPVQVIDAPQPTGLPVYPVLDEPRLRAAVEAELARPFDLERGWPARACLMRLSEQEHVLVVAFHHIACDAWSVRLFASELSALYGELTGGPAAALEPLAVQYADYAAWQRRHLAGENLERELSYWRGQLDGVSRLELPTDRPRTAGRGYAGDSVPFTVPAAVADRVRALSLEHGTTPFTFLLTAYQVLLSRYTGSADIPVGVTVSGRDRPELQRVIGYGINTLAIRGRWDGDPAFGALLDASSATVLAAFDHQQVPFARLVDELQPDRDPAYTPIYQVDFVMHEDRTDAFALPGLQVEPLGEDRVAKFDLTLMVTHAPDGEPMRGRLGYATALFDRETAERMTRGFVALLESAAARPQARLSEMDVLSAAERADLTAGGRGPVRAVGGSVIDRFEARVADSADATAVVFGAETWTYQDLDLRANQTARRLRAAGVDADVPVGVLLERSPDLVAGLLAVWKAGGVYVPLDPQAPIDRTAHMLADTAAPILVTTTDLAERLSGTFSGELILLDADLPADPEGVAPSRALHELSGAYVIYTSGSTGVPKGVVVSQQGLANYIDFAVESYASNPGGAPVFSPVSFDLGVPNIFAPLVTGQPVTVLPQDLDGADLGAALVAAGPFGFIKLTPAHLELLTHQLTAEQAAGLAGLVIAAGDEFSTDLARRWYELAGPDGTRIATEYGPTEITVGNSGQLIDPVSPSVLNTIPLGDPIANTSMYVLDGHGQLAPLGVPGEVFIGGTGLARGYLGRPDLTADKFIPDPFGPSGARLYRTGDLARRLPDGSLEFLGRIDTQVKIRGYRIELGEIQARLRALDSVVDAVVIAREDTPGHKTLVAYVVAAEDTDADPATYRAHLEEALPGYMVPSAFVAVDRIPLTANGKLDVRALPAPDRDAFGGTERVAPSSDTELLLAEVWAQALGRDVADIGVHDSFFDLGGDSIRAVGLAGALRERGVAVSIRDIFTHRTIARLATHVTVTEARPFASVEPFSLISEQDRAALPADAVDAYPLSQIQTGMLVEWLTGGGAGTYVSITSFRVPDTAPFSADALRRALDAVAARHQILRTSIHLTGYAQPLQIVHGAVEIPVTLHDLRHLDEAAQQESAQNWAREQRSAEPDLTVAPLVQVHVHLESEQSWRLTFIQNHALTEGWSINALTMEVLGAYRSSRDGETDSGYEAPVVRYADFIAAEAAALEDPAEGRFWKRITDGHVPVALPEAWGVRDEPAVPVSVAVDYADVEEQLRDLASRAGASLKAVLLAAHLKVMSALSTEDAFHVGVVTHGRLEAPGADRVLGMHLNTLPFPCRGLAATWQELVEQTYATETEIWGHRRYPLPAIQRAAGADRLLTVLFEFHDFHVVDSGRVDAEGTIGGASNEFALNVIARDGLVHLTASSQDLGAESAERLAAMYRHVLAAMAADPLGDATAAPIPAAERARLTTEWNPVVPEEVSACLHEVFQGRAARNPDAVAVVFADSTLTYRELNERANQIAHRLRDLGVGPEMLVGVCLERGIDLMPALLGVLKAGAAYVPLDPANPADRLAYILEDAGAAVLISRSTVGGVADTYQGPRLLLDTDADVLAGQPTGNPPVATRPGSLVYVIYTSGSTGRPKGVAVEHANIMRLFAVTDRFFRFSADDAWSLVHSYAFDFSVWEIWGALLHGGRLVIASYEDSRSPAALLRLLTEQRVTILNQTPSAFYPLIDADRDSGAPPGDLALRFVVFGGEALDIARLRPWYDRHGFDGPVLANMYGITETSVHTTYREITEDDVAHGSRSHIGRPLPDLTVHLLDRHGALVPVGVPGEIHVGGGGVVRGYLGRPELTAQRFVADPFGPAGSRLYRSGDLARRLPDGSLEFLGRIDTQVKIRGYRIELGEIQALLRAQESVRDAVVIAREDTPGHKTLAAYIVAADGGAAEPDVLRTALSDELPEYMVPSAFVAVDRIPLTTNGKLDVRALPAPDRDAFSRAERVAPRSETERLMAGAWAVSLGLDAERISVHDSFFDLGGDSIRAVGLAGALRECGLAVGIRDIFERRTIARLAEDVDIEEAVPFRSVEPFSLISEQDRAELPGDAVDAYPLSQIQTGMLVEMLTGDGRRAYHNLNSFRIPDAVPFSADAMRQAVDTVAARHQMLRTSIHLTGYSQPLQVVHAAAEVPLEVHDLRGLPAEEVQRISLEFADRQRDGVFDPTVAPLIRMAVHVESEDAWRLTFTQSHAITEGWSYHSMLMEILAAYRSVLDGSGPDGPDGYESPAVRYADFIAAELASLDDAEDREYWRSVTDGYTPLTLPDVWGDRQSPVERYRLTVPFTDLGAGLRELASRADASLKSVLLAAHLKVMSALTTEDAFHTGLIAHGRLEAPGAMQVLGMHLNTVPFPHRGRPATWLELVRQTFATESEIWSHRRYPLPAIQRASDNAQRLISVMYEFLDFHHVDTGQVDVEATLTEAPTEFDLHVSSSHDAVSIIAGTDTVTHEHAKLLAGLYRSVLVAMAADPLGDAAGGVLSGEVLEQAVQGSDGPVVPFDGVPVHQAFETLVDATPDAVAVITGDGASLSYCQVDARANQIARRLRSLGAGPGVLVGVCLERGADLVPALLGVLKTGAGYLPLDPGYPAERLGWILTDADAPLLLCEAATQDMVSEGFAGVRVLVEDTHGESVERLSMATHPAGVVYTIYTSGSTGRPKGVVLTHADLGNFIAAFGRLLPDGGRGVWLASTSVSFDISNLELWLPLTCGGSVVVAGRGEAGDPVALIRLIEACRVQVVQATPSGWRMLLAAGFDRPEVTGLAGGEELPAALAGEIRARVGRLLNVYGPTEATVWASTWEVPAAGWSTVKLGVPLANYSWYVLDRFGYPVAPGAAGELHIGGESLARGYLGRPDLTADRFVPDPFGAPGTRLYRTGDLARRLSDGSVEFLGRIDTQVKIRGYRIELGEIESRLRAEETVRDAVVIAREDVPGDKTLVAYVVAADGAAVDPVALRARLETALPEYMVPGAFVALDRIPLNTAGKVDARALPAPDREAFGGAERVAPSTETELVLARVWAEVLGLDGDRIGVHDSFFDVGGDSIRAVGLAVALRDRGFEVGIRDIFENRTISQLAAHVGEAEAAVLPFRSVEPFALISEADRAALPADAADAYPLSQVQIGMLVEMLAGAGADTYVHLNSVRIPDDRPFDPDALRRAVDLVTVRHDRLRTSVRLSGYSQPLQIVHTGAEVPLLVHDLRHLDADARQEAVFAWAREQRSGGVDLAAAPMFQIHVHVEPDAWRVSFIQAHAFTDGWSDRSMVRELVEAYRLLRAGADGVGYEAPVARYADFVAAELAALDDPAEAEFWKAITDTHAPVALPEAWGTPDEPATPVHASVDFLDVEEELRALASRSGASLKSVLLAAHLKVMSALSTEDGFHVGVVVHGRLEAPGAEKVLGMHLNTLPFPYRGLPATWQELVGQTFATETEIWGHRRFPLPAIQRAAGTDRLITVLFEFHDFQQMADGPVDVAAVIGGASNEFALNVITRGGQVHLTASSRDLSAEYAQRLAGMYRHVLVSMAADPLGDALASPVPPADQVELVAGGLGELSPVGGFVIDRFEAQVAESGDESAVVFGAETWTYQDLDRRANQIARRLRAAGVDADVPVGVLLERSPDLVAGLLAVWKAGGVYVPLDPQAPIDRSAHMLTDTGASVLVTTSELAERLSWGFSGELILLDADLSADSGSVAPPRALHGLSGAYVIYTSGSTGVPKGVLVSQQSLANYIDFAVESYASNPGGAPVFSPVSFDLGVPNIFAPLVTGQPVTVLPQDLDGADLGAALVAAGPFGFIKLTPAHLELLTHQLTAEQAAGLAGLVIAAGDEFSTDLARRWYELAGPDGTRIATEYGPTEITVGNSGQLIDPVAPSALSTIPLGDPIANTSMYVLDNRGGPVPLGVQGEVFIGGVGLARGYLGRPDLTADKFIPDPFGPAGARLYRTGDLARRLPDGSLEFLGRIDTQVKIRGYRIELGEIQARLRALDSVVDAVVIAREDTPGHKTLAAYLVAAEDASVDTAALRDALAVTLPEYMVPNAFVTVDRIPLTANGKLDVRALPAPDRDAFGGAERVAPSTDTELLLAEVWAQVLGLDVESISVHDSFFDLGGDSIRAVGLAGALREHGFGVSIRDIFAHRTIAGLAEFGGTDEVRQFRTAEPFSLISEQDRAALPADAADAYPLSLIQTGMIVEMLADERKRNYLDVSFYRIPDTVPFSPEALRAAVHLVATRHEILRTTIHLTGYSQPLQIVHAEEEVPVRIEDLRHLDPQAQYAFGVGVLDGERAEGFEVADAPLLRVGALVESDASWRLIFTHCHAVTEGWSMHTLTMEVLNAYWTLRDGGEPAEYEAPAVRYADFIAAEQLALDDPEEQRYWKSVTDTHSAIALPDAWGDRSKPREPHHQVVRYTDLMEPLRALAGQAGASLKSVLLAAHLKVMSALSTGDAFHVGVVVHGRLEAPGSEKVLGMHLNTLPFPSVGRPATWLELVRQTYATETEIWGHRRYPLPAIQRAAASGPITVLFDFLDFHQMDNDRVDVESEYHAAPNEFALNVTVINDRVILATGTTAVSPEYAERLAGMYRHVLASMAADPSGDALASPLPAAEQVDLLADGLGELRPVGGFVIDRFEALVAESGDELAVVFGDEEWSYQDLDSRANQIAQRLRAAGVGADVPVGVLLGRSPVLIAGLLAVWKAGGVYVPLDPTAPVDRLAHMLADTDAPVLVTTSDLAERLSGTFTGELILLDADLPADPEGVAPSRVLHELSGAYVIYTSGSTGVPKGVVVSQQGLANYIDFAVKSYASNPGGAPVFSPVSFDLGVPNIFAPLVTGQPVTVLPQDLDGANLGAALVAAGPFGFIKLTPAHLELLTHQLSADEAANLAGLIIAAGDEFSTDLARRWYELAGPDGMRIATEYGPTEITVGNSGQLIDPVTPSVLSTIPLGDPIANTTMYVLDGDGHLAPLGVPGEVFIGGTGLARGYLGRPDLTAEKFVPDPFGPAGARLYRTGDLARRLPDGSLEFLGRIDTQVKIRGYRIELGEIQALLRAQESVRDAVVIAREDTPGHKTLAAYIVAADGEPIEPAALRDALAVALPEYMVPSAFVAVDRIPLTANGKLDVKALPAPDRDAFGGAEHVAPSTATEVLLAQVWAQVLGLDVDGIGVHDSFFDLGGDSIRAVGLAGALREHGLALSIRDIFAHRTIALLATQVTVTEAKPFQTVEPFSLIAEEDRAALPADAVDAYPLSQIQTGMIVEMLADPDRNTYHSVNSFRIPDDRPLAVDVLRRAVDIVSARHETLRTSIHLTGFAQPLQVVRASAAIPIAVHDLRGLTPEEMAEAGLAFAARERDRLFDLPTAPLVRIGIHLEPDHVWRLTFTHCNAITEGWSYHNLLMEILQEYRALREDRTPPAYDAPAVRYADYIAAELAALDDPAEQSFWRDVTAGHVPMQIPDSWGDKDSPVERYRLTVPFGDLAEPLRALASRAGASLKAVTLAAHLKVMSALTTEEAFHVGVVTHGRLEAPGADRVLGMHLNTLPFPHSGRPATWLDLVEQTYATETEIWGHRRYPLPAIQHAAGASQRLISVMLEFHDFHQMDGSLVDNSGERNSVATDFAFHVISTADAFHIISGTDIVTRDYAERLAGMYRQVVAEMAADPEGDATGGVLPPAEAARILAAGAGSRTAEPVALTVHEAFEQRAAAHPDRQAVTAGRDRLTYRQLDERANQIAHHLRALGAGPETLVGLCLERGPDLLPALLGILKAGAAYVSLDPANPAGRLVQILADTKAPLVVTTGQYAGELSSLSESLTTQYVVLDRPADAAAIAARPKRSPGVRVAPSNLAYVLYTSGSTGTPKGCAVTHANVLRLFRTGENEFAFEERDVWAMFHSYAFDTSVWESFGALLHGGRLVVVPPQTARSPEDLLDLLVAEQITVLCQTPTAFRGLAAMAGDGRLARIALRAVIFAGERLDMTELLPWVRRLGLEKPALINMYGITETSVFSVQHRLDDSELSFPTLSVIGTTMGDQKTHLLDRYGNPVPIGAPGEIHVGGPAVARGYVGRPAQTAERFVPDPYGPPGARLYRSGDLARMRPDGSLEFLGRIDAQVKIRGYRIEPGEIVARLRTRPDVRDAVVVAREDVPGDKTLVAYLVPADGAEPDVAEVRTRLAGELPPYMVPAAFMVIDALPLTTNGKLDHRALPVPDGAARSRARRTAPRTEVEAALVRVWAEVLRTDPEQIGIEDGFFEVGGDSIRAVRMLPVARREGLELSIWMLYQAKTLEELATLIGTGVPEPGAPMLTPAQRLAIEGVPGTRSIRLALSRRPDAETLERALHAVVARHQALRLRIADADDAAIASATVAPAETARLSRTVDLDGVPVGERPALIAQALEQDAATIDPARGPLLRAALCSFGGGVMQNFELLPELWITVHDLAVDDASWPVLVADLNAAYRQLASGGSAELPSVAVPFTAVAEELAERAIAGIPAEQAQALADREAGEAIPVDRPAGTNTDTNADANRFGTAETITTVLPAGATEALLQTEEPQAVLLTALGRALTGWSGGRTVDVDLLRDPRTVFGDAQAVGLLADRLPVHLRLPADRPAAAQLRSVTRQVRALPPAWCGYGSLRFGGDQALAEDLAALERPQVGFAFVAPEASSEASDAAEASGTDAPLAFAPELIQPVRPASAPRPRLLDVDARVHDGRLYIRWTYSNAVHEAETVRGVADRQLAEVQALVESADTPRAAKTAAGAGAVTGAATDVPQLAEEMARHGIPGAALALIQDGQLAVVQTYGTLEAGGIEPVTQDTVFAAGSISKHVTTVAVLKLVAAGLLDLDTDVNEYLTSWRVPGDPAPRVTLRHLLSHTAGFAVDPPFKRYAPDEPFPTVLEILHGRPPAVPPTFAHAPGEVFAMTALNFSVTQQVMCDVTGEEFPALMRRLVLDPLGMGLSTYDPSQVRAGGRPYARGHGAGNVPVPGGFQVMPELAAGALWSTPQDIARLSIAVRESYLGLPDAFLPRDLARQMLTPQADRPYGWSTIIDDSGADREIGHGGQATGFQAMFGMRLHAGRGAVLLTNATTGRELVTGILTRILSAQTKFSVLWQQASDAQRARDAAARQAVEDGSLGPAETGGTAREAAEIGAGQDDVRHD